MALKAGQRLKKNEIEDRSLKMIQSKEKRKSEKLLLTFMCNFS